MKKVLGTIQPDWNLLTMDHIKYALGHNTPEPYDTSLDLDSMNVDDILSMFK